MVCVVTVVQVAAHEELEGLKVLGQLMLAILHLPYLFYAMHTNIIQYVSYLSFQFSLRFTLECKRSYKLKFLSISGWPLLVLRSMTRVQV